MFTVKLKVNWFFLKCALANKGDQWDMVILNIASIHIVIYSLFLDEKQDKNTWGFSVKKKFGVASFGSLVIWPFSFRKSPFRCLLRKSGTNARKNYTCLKMLSVFFFVATKNNYFLQKTESRLQWSCNGS